MNEIDVSKCPYYGECGIVNNCILFEQCRVKELFDDFYKVEKLYMDSQNKLQQLKAENEELEEECERLKKLGSYGILQEVKKNKQIENCLDEIEEHIETCNSTMYCKDCKFSENCQHIYGQDWGEIVLQLIKQAKEGK